MFSKTTEYALRAVIYIAQKGTEDNKLGLAEIAKAIRSPRSFTAKILQQLTTGGKIISSVRGPGGGFYISASAKKNACKVSTFCYGRRYKVGEMCTRVETML